MRRFSFQLEKEEYQKELNLEHLNQLPENIRNILFSSEKYQVQAEVIYQNFKTFIDCFVDKKPLPKINRDNVYDFHQLSNEFSIMKDYFLSDQFEHLYRASVLNRLKSENYKDKYSFEQYISLSLDYFIDKHPNDIIELPINSLCNIFFNENRKLNDHKKAYQLITSQQVNNENLCILISSLDGSKLDDEMFDDSISKRNERYGFIPQFSMKNIKQEEQFDLQEIGNDPENLKKNIKKIKKDFEYQIKKIDYQYSCQIKEFEYKIKQLERQYSCQIKDMVKELSISERKVDDQYKQINDQIKMINRYEHDNKNLQKKFKKYHDDINSMQKELKCSIDTIKKQEIILHEKESTIQLQNNRIKELENVIRVHEQKMSEQKKIIENFQVDQTENGNSSQEKNLIQKLYGLFW